MTDSNTVANSEDLAFDVTEYLSVVTTKGGGGGVKKIQHMLKTLFIYLKLMLKVELYT